MRLDPADTLRFGDFELDVAAYTLRRQGRRVRIERQPMEPLLFEYHDRLVARTQIVERLWPTDVFIDVEGGVNTAFRKLRLALHDTRGVPRFVETITGKGYRFIAPVRVVAQATRSPAPIRWPSCHSRSSAARRTWCISGTG